MIRPWQDPNAPGCTQSNGARLETYAITGVAGSGVIGVNGAAAHLMRPGDLVIIITYVGVPDEALDDHRPRIVHVDVPQPGGRAGGGPGRAGSW